MGYKKAAEDSSRAYKREVSGRGHAFRGREENAPLIVTLKPLDDFFNGQDQDRDRLPYQQPCCSMSRSGRKQNLRAVNFLQVFWYLPLAQVLLENRFL